MKRIATLTVAAAMAVVLAVNLAHAADAKKKKGNTSPAKPADPMARFDKNANGVLENQEREALREAFAKDASLKTLDLNGDGKLDESEINAVEVPPKAKGKGGAKKKKAD